MFAEVLSDPVVLFLAALLLGPWSCFASSLFFVWLFCVVLFCSCYWVILHLVYCVATDIYLCF